MHAHPDGKSTVVARQFKGAMNIYSLRLPSGKTVHAYQPHTRIIQPGTPVHVLAAPGHPLACFKDGVAVPVLEPSTVDIDNPSSSFLRVN
jgi:hypothetical protein